MKLVNENGTLVGKDPESGETIPVEFDAVDAGSINADSVSTDSFSAGFMPEISTVPLNGRDPQGIVDAVDPYTRIVADPTNQHTISSPLTVTTEGLRLEGFNLFVEAGAECDCIDFRSDHGRVRNCRLDGNRENQSSGVAGIEDANGVTVTNCTDVIVERCHVVQTRAQGILVSSYHSGRDGGGPVSHVRVRDNTIEGVWNGGILVQGGGEDPCEFVWIENNEVRNFQNEGIQAIDGCQNVWLTDNEVMGDTPGMVVENHFDRGVDRPIRNVIFSGNTVDVDSDGFIVEHPAESLENVTISGNTINASGDGISVGDADWGDLSVTDNTIIGDGDGNGIYINPNSLDGIEIRGNLIKQFERGVFKDSAPLVQGNVTDNRFYGCTDGIIWQDSPGANITGNFCRVGDRGIVIKSHLGGNVTGEQIYDPGDVYGTWTFVEFDFDWGNGEYSYTIEDLESGHTETGTRDLGHGVDAAELHIQNWNTGDDDANGFGTDDFMYIWFDDVRVSADDGDEVLWDFEDGLGDWQALDDDFEQKSDVAFNGGHSAGIEDDTADPEVATVEIPSNVRDGGVDTISFYWSETEDSYGGGLRVLNSQGNYETSFATDNSQWFLQDSGGETTVSGVKVTGNHIEEEDGVTADGIETLQESGLLDSYLIKHNSISVSGTAVNDTVSGANSEVGSNQVY